MPKVKNSGQKPIEQYEHTDKERLNNPPVGLVDSKTDNGGQRKKTYEYDPHLDPQLQWAGKAEHTSFEVPTVSLHVHERIDPRRIIEQVRKVDGEQWVVDSKNQKIILYGDLKKLSGIGSLAEINGSGGNDLSDDAGLSEGGDVRAKGPDAAGGRFDSVKHSGGPIAELYRRILSFFGDRPGQPGRTGDADTAQREAQALDERGLREKLIALARDKENALWAEKLAKIVALTPDSFPLSTAHYPLSTQPSLFEAEKKPLREAIEFYKHKDAWSNRLIAGDSLLVMNSLLEKEGMGGKVQMIYFDPPYGIKYGSNFQPFVNKRDVKDGKDEDLTAEPEMIKAFRDTWELGIHSYLTYLRDRLLLAKELLHESGSIFVQISDENVHRVRGLLDEVFGPGHFCAQINYRSMQPLSSDGLDNIYDYILWYAKDISVRKFRPLYLEKPLVEGGEYRFIDDSETTGGYRSFGKEEAATLHTDVMKLPIFRRSDLVSSGYTPSCIYPIDFDNKTFVPRGGKSWRTHQDGLKRLVQNKRIFRIGDSLYFKLYYTDFPYLRLANSWHDTMGGFAETKRYVVETAPKIVTRCLQMTTDPGDLVLDITCGSGTTAFVAENWGRRWITCDTSRVAVALAKQRLMTADFDYFDLAHPDEGVGSGFRYKTVPHITLKSIANNEPAPQETLYDQPFIDNKKLRITGPFTVEAVPSPTVMQAEPPASAGGTTSAIGDVDLNPGATPPAHAGGSAFDASVARSGETLRQSEWIDRLKDGIRGKGGANIEFTRVEPLGGTHYLQAEAETRSADTPVRMSAEHEDTLAGGTGDADKSVRAPKRVVICFGPEHAPLEKRLVDLALTEAEHLRPAPQLILFCAFQFDPEARKYIDETVWKDVQLLEAQMDADLQTDDLKKKPRDKTNPGFWLIGQPDVQIVDSGKRTVDNEPLYTVSVNGFDYYNPKTGEVESGGKGDIAMWMLDPDYDDRSLFPTQVFFPMAGDKEGWAKLAKNLKAEIDEEKIEAFRGTESLPFTPGRKVAVKIIDARGIESLKIIHL